MKTFEPHAFPHWNDAVEATRKNLCMPLTRLEGLSEWLQSAGKGTFLRIAKSTFKSLALSDRFFGYFAACVLTHHKEAGYVHALPAELRLALALPSEPLDPSPISFAGEHGYTYPGQGYFRIFYTSRPHKVAPGWEAVGVPSSFEVWWPNIISRISGPGIKPDPDNWERYGIDWKRHHVSSTGDGDLLPPRYSTNWEGHHIVPMSIKVMAYELESEIYILPFIFGSGVEGNTPMEVFPRIPGNAKTFAGICDLPLLSFPGLAMGIALDTAVGRCRWQDPKVVLDVPASKEDEERAKVWKNFIRYGALIPEKVWPKELRPERGHPYRDKPAPGMRYKERLKVLYCEKIARFSSRPPHEKLAKLRNSAQRQARKEFPHQQRERVPREFWERIEEEVWGKKI